MLAAAVATISIDHRARVQPRCEPARACLLCLLCCALGLRCLQQVREFAQAGFGLLRDQPAENIGLHWIEIGGQGQVDEQPDDRLFVGAFECRTHCCGVKL
jgi:hypothetical protein